MTKRTANIFALWAFTLAAIFALMTWRRAGADADWSSILIPAIAAVAFFLTGLSFLVGWRTK
jgi:hypothetical protein